MAKHFTRDRDRRCGKLFLAAAIAAIYSSSAFAQVEQTLAPVVVSASRFPSDPAFRPVGASVITADDIREAGIDNVNEAVRRIGGVYARQSFNGTQDYTLDLRGFGANADQNLVVMVDGVRISENELNPALLSSIPIESVERIEILRGGGSVLYGEGASGGVIQVITKHAAADSMHGTVVGEAGSYADRELRASAAKGWQNVAIDANLGTQRADNYRANSASRQNNFSSGVQWFSNEGRIGLRVDTERQDSRLPGALTMAQFQTDPRQTVTPKDFGSLDVTRYTLFAERRISGADFAAELSHQDKNTRGFFSSSFGDFDSNADSGKTQFSPRLRYISVGSDWKNELVAGIDLLHWNRHSLAMFAGSPSSNGDASQSSRALYVRDEVRIGKGRIAVGARHENFDKSANDPVSFSAYTQSFGVNAWELQGVYTVLPKFDVFAKLGSSYRVANVDENAATPVFNQPLLPQTSHDAELGASYGDGNNAITVRVFQHRLRNEIFFDPTRFANVNLDPTKREGLEIEGTARLAKEWSLRGTVQHIDAKFTDGPNAGKEMVLVPRNNATLRVEWLPGGAHSANLGMQWVDSQRYGNDFSNACAARMPAFTVFDGHYAYHTGPWEFALTGINLTDKHYFTQAFGACQSGIYPDMGRQLKLSARYSF
jgi:iron complex outermembrane receptor protein